MGSRFGGAAYRHKPPEFLRTRCLWWFTKFVVCRDQMTYRQGKHSQSFSTSVEGFATHFSASRKLQLGPMWQGMSCGNRKPIHLCEKWRPTRINTTHWHSVIFVQMIEVVV
jgi:hypothetical protein